MSRSDRGAKQRPDLRSEDLGLVQAHADRTPAEKRVGFGRGLERDRELVAAEVVRPDDDRVAVERGRHPPEVVGLLGLVGSVARPVSRNSVRSRPTPCAPMRTAASISSGRSTLPIRLMRPPPGVTAGASTTASSWSSSRCRRLTWVFASSSSSRGRIEHDGAGLAVEQHHHPRRISASAPPAPMTAGNAERVRQDRGVRGPGAFLADEPHDVLAIELHREPGRELVRDNDHLLVGGDGPELVPLAAPCSRLSMRSWIAWRSARRSRSRAAPETTGCGAPAP